MKQQDIAVVLNELLDTARDTQQGFELCITQVSSPQLAALLRARAQECQTACSELQVLIAQCGGTHGTGGTVAGKLRGLFRGHLTGTTDPRTLDECERGAHLASDHYRKTLEMDLPGPVRSVVQAHHQGMLETLEQLHTLRHHWDHLAQTGGPEPQASGLLPSSA